MSNLTKRFAILLILGCIFIPGLKELQAQTPFDLRGNRLHRRIGTMDGNLVLTKYKNYGEVTDYPNEPSGNWPTYGRHYCDGVALIVSAEVTNGYGQVIHPMETQYREFVDSSPTGIPWGFEPRPFWFNGDQQENFIPAVSNEPISWPDGWPDKPRSWDGYWNGYFGKGIFNADLETVFVFDDDADKEYNRQVEGSTNWNYWCDELDSTRGGLGLVVKARGFQWSHVLAEDCIFWLYNIQNESTHDYEKVFYSQYIDWGIGGVEDGADDIGEYDAELDIAFAYDTDGYGTPGNWSPVGYAGYAFLESPGIGTDGVDNDEDGIIDELRFSDDPGVWIDTAPYGFNGAAWDDFVAMFLREPTAHWSNDEDCDWDGYLDMNGNNVWDYDEPLNDDLGADGVGPYDIHYGGPDEGEGDGLPTNGEPDYNETDPDESDQIGLTGFDIFATHDYELTNDEQNWGVFARALVPVHELLQPNNLAMFFSSGTFPLRQGRTERYSMSLLFGEDRDDLLKNKRTVQQIYNADYRFSKPPLKPTLTVYPGDGQVTLVWDDIAEKSFDPFLQEFDFEGYMIYKSTEAQFLENKIITDSYGNLTFRQPVVQYDLDDEWFGPHPIDIYGVKLNMGENTGLRHTWTDTDVYNGQTYYYAIVAYDYGLVDYNNGPPEGLSPSLCSSIIKTDAFGRVTFQDVNCGVAVPRPYAAGYTPPQLDDDIQHEGPATGSIDVDVIADYQVPSGSVTYELEFHDSTLFHTEIFPEFSLRDVVQDTLVLDTTRLVARGQESPLFNGSLITFQNDTSIVYDLENSGWIDGESDYTTRIRLNPDWEIVAGRRLNLNMPADYEIEFLDSNTVQTENAFGLSSRMVNVSITNITDSSAATFALWDHNADQMYNHGDDLVILVPDPDFIFHRHTSWVIRFESKFSVDTVWVGGVPGLDTTIITTDPPMAGDKFLLTTKKPFRDGEKYRFTINGPDSSNTLAKNELSDIHVVPDPYVVAASWEPQNYFRFGRGERRIQFFNLPSRCTIRIYTLNGNLVDILEHDASADNGMEPWDLLTSEGSEISFGTYFYHVDAPDIGTHVGRFSVIK
jgi:hypothetical protein